MEIIGVVLGAEPGKLSGVVRARSRGLIWMAGRRLVERHVEALSRLGIRPIVVLSEPGDIPGARVVVQRSPGIMGAVMDALSEAPGNPSHALIVFADFVTSGDPYSEVINTAIELGADGAALIVARQDVEAFVRAGVEGVRVTGFGEGRYVFGGILLTPINALRGEEFYQALNDACRSIKIAAVHWSGKWHAVDYPWDLVYALEIALDMRGTYIAPSAKVSKTAVLEGPVHVDEGAEIDHHAVIKGPAYIGRNSFIGAHTLIRNYTDVEQGAVIGAYSELTHTIVQPNAFIGPHSYVAYSVIGEESVLEPGVKTLAILREPLRRMRPIEVRGREFYKLGAFIRAATRVPANTVLRPGTGFT